VVAVDNLSLDVHEREGSGPGEFREIAAVCLGPSGNLHVFDRAQGRVTELSPEFEFISTRNIPPNINDNGGVVLGDGTVLINKASLSAERLGQLLHVVGSDGLVISSFGATGEPDIPHDLTGPRTVRWITDDGTGGVWVAHFEEYVVENWGLDGVLHRRLHNEEDWFRKPEESSSNRKPQVLDLVRDEAGRLRVIIRVPATQPRGRGEADPWAKDNLWDYVVQVINPTNGLIEGTGQFAGFAAGFLTPDTIFAYRWLESGQTILDVWRVRLRQGQKTR